MRHTSAIEHFRNGFVVEDGDSATHDAIRAAVAAVDAVFALPDGVTPVPVVVVDRANPVGTYRGQPDGSPSELSVSIRALDPGFTFLHEVGHFLDHSVLGGAAGVATSLPLLERWRDAVRATQAAQELLGRALNPRMRLVRQPDGSIGHAIEDVGYILYLLGLDELFARSASQYLVERSREGTLLRELAAAQRLPYREQWETADFDAVRDVFDREFTARGMLLP